MAAQPGGGSCLFVERAAIAVARDPVVEIVVPVHNEERDLEPGVRRLRAYLDARFPFHATLTCTRPPYKWLHLRQVRWQPAGK